MGTRYRSAKGEMVDMDLLKIKQNLKGKPTTANVKAREDFVDGRMRRRKKIPKLPQELLDNIKLRQEGKHLPSDNKDKVVAVVEEKKKTEDKKPKATKPRQRARPSVDKDKDDDIIEIEETDKKEETDEKDKSDT